MRIEKDNIGKRELPSEALYGLQSLRASENFPFISAFPLEWYKAIALVKLAYYRLYADYKKNSTQKYGDKLNNKITFIDDEIFAKLIESAEEVSRGLHFEHFIVPAVSGGAGTSINMNVNEIIANATLLKLGHNAGNYAKVHPLTHANLYQSTNDVIPSALKIAAMHLLNQLEDEINLLRSEIEQLESKYRFALRIGYTQLQEAVPTTFGRLFSSYSEALSRDWWRVSKCNERLKTLNLGGSAVGTSLGVPRYFVMLIVERLRELTNLPIARAENLSDATSNLDVFVEVSAIMKSNAVNLEKMADDIRLLASDMVGKNEISIAEKQIGSTIMPGKVNPVISEFIISASRKVFANDMLISDLAARGNLELNAYLPTIGVALIENLKLLIAMNRTARLNLINGLAINQQMALENLMKSPAITTALVPFIGYEKANEIAKHMKENKMTISEANKKLKLLSDARLEEILKPDNLLKNGFTISDLINED